MNKKVIISIICLAILVCIAVAVWQGVNGSEAKETTAVPLSGENILNETSVSTQKTDEVSVISTSETISETKETQTADKKVNTSEQTQGKTAEKQTKASQATTSRSQVQSSVKQNPPKAKPNTESSSKKELQSSSEKQQIVSSSQQTPQTITVSLAINCKNALKYDVNVPQSGYFIAKTSCKVKDGKTAFDLLEEMCSKNGLSLKYQSKTYIQAIGGLAEKDCGGMSGWMYKVNGSRPNMPATKYVLKNGDYVEWYYVTSPND